MNKEVINILILGGSGVGKSTLTNAFNANYTFGMNKNKNNNESIMIESFFNINDYSVDVKLMNTNEYGENDECKEKILEMSKYIDIFLIMYDINYFGDIHNYIAKIINENNYGNYFVIFNKCDEFTINDKNQITNDKNIYDSFCDKLKDNNLEIDNVIFLKAYDAYLYRYLYFYSDDTIHDEETEKKINELILELVGKVAYKNVLSDKTLKNKKKYMDDEFDFDDIFNNAMIESGFLYLEDKIESVIENNFDVIKRKHIFNDLEEIKNKNNNLCDTVDDINIIIDKMEKVNNIDNLQFECLKTYVITCFISKMLFLMKTPEKITTRIINKLEDMNNKIIDKFGDNLLGDYINNLQILRKDNLVNIFKNYFDSEILLEAKDKIDINILHHSLKTTFSKKNFDFNEYYDIIKIIAKITDYNVEYVTVASLFYFDVVKFENKNGDKVVKRYFEEKIINETNDKVVYVFLNLLNEYNYRNSIICSDIILCNYNDYVEYNKNAEQFYNFINLLFNEKKYEKYQTFNDIQTFVKKLDSKYENTKLSLTIKQNTNIETLQLIETLHQKNLLSLFLEKVNLNNNNYSDTDSSEEITKKTKKVKNNKKNYSDSETDSDNDTTNKKKVVTIIPTITTTKTKKK